MTREEEIKLASFEHKRFVMNYSDAFYTDNADSFEAGAEWADTNPKSPWISVKDDLPHNHPKLLEAKYQTKKVFIMKDLFGNPDVDYMLNVDGKWRWSAYNGTKYWFPIPEPPKE